MHQWGMEIIILFFNHSILLQSKCLFVYDICFNEVFYLIHSNGVFKIIYTVNTIIYIYKLYTTTRYYVDTYIYL